MSAIELLDLVHDRESFLDFAQALADERREAEEIELSQPENYKWGAGALGWYNTCISQFIEAAMSHFEPDAEGQVIEHVTWKDLAEFLYSG